MTRTQQWLNLTAALVAAVLATAALALVAAARAGAAGTAVALTTAPADTTAPVTVISGFGSDWRRRWVLHLWATDEGGSGVARTEYKVDDAVEWTTGTRIVVTSSADHGNDGVHTVTCRSVDVAGNVEEPIATRVRVDTRPPTVKQLRTAVAHTGDRVRVPYLIEDAQPCSGWAQATLQVVREYRSGMETLMLTKPLKRMHAGVWRAGAFHCDFAPGLYVCFISARDDAGNQAVVDSMLLRVLR